MAEHKVSGNDMAILLSRDGITYNTVVCLTSYAFTRGTAIIDAKSMCGPDTLPGAKSNGLTFEGQVLEDPDSGRVSTDELDDYWRNTDTVYFKFGKLVPTEGDETYSGTCFIAKLDVQGSMDAPVTFSAELGIYGIASKTTATS